jgi:hypothetical protein
MSLPDNLQKGDPLVLVSEDRNESAEEVVVSRVGRRYLYVARKGSVHEDSTPFDLVTGAAQQNIGWARTLVTPEQYADMTERKQLKADLWETGVEIRLPHRDKVSTDQLRGLLAVMQAEEPEE